MRRIWGSAIAGLGVHPHRTGPGAMAAFRATASMAHTEIPKNVRRLILRHIESVQQVEILALLRDHPEREWSPDEVSRTLHIGPSACAAWLARFADARLVDRTDAVYRHARSGPDVRAADALVDCFARRRLAVIDAIYGKPDPEQGDAA